MFRESLVECIYTNFLFTTILNKKQQIVYFLKYTHLKIVTVGLQINIVLLKHYQAGTESRLLFLQM